MHARSGAWRCCDGKNERQGCNVSYCSFIVLCWTLNLHWYVLLGSSKKITSCDHWITALSQISGRYSSRCPSCITKALRLRAIWRLPSANVCEAARIAKCECLRSRANCQVRMFVKQPNRQLQQLLAVENKPILQQLKPSTLHMMFQLTLIFYQHHTGMRSEMLYTNGSFEIFQERCLWSSVEKTAEALTCCRKKYLYSSKKWSNLYMICFNSVKKFLSNYLCTLHWHAFTNALH